MRKGWEYKKLGEVCDVINGYAFKSSKYTSQGTRIIRITNVQKGYVVDNDPKFYSDEDFKDLFQYSLFEGDLVMSLTGNVGRVGILQKNMIPAALNQRVACLRVKSEKMRLNYLFHLLNSNLFEIAAIQSARGIAQLNMSTEWLKNYIIPLPPPSTQLAIVSELDKINELIRLKKEQLKDFDNLAQSLFYEMFGDPVENEKGWEVKKIGDLALVKTGPFGSMLHKEDYICDGIPLVNPIHMKDYKIVPDLDFTISKEKASELENYLLKSNDVVFARRGDIGRCAIVSEAEQGFICGTGSLFVRFSKEIESIFIMYIIRCDSFTKHLISKAKGATMLNINSNTIADLRIPLPPLPLQHLFAQRIEQIEREKSEVQKSIQDLETLLASRMQYWFE
mgnify:CR=1 FL=1